MPVRWLRMRDDVFHREETMRGRFKPATLQHRCGLRQETAMLSQLGLYKECALQIPLASRGARPEQVTCLPLRPFRSLLRGRLVPSYLFYVISALPRPLTTPFFP